MRRHICALPGSRAVTENQERAIARGERFLGREENVVPFGRRLGEVAKGSCAPAAEKSVADLVWDLECETDRGERGNDRSVPVGSSTGEEVATLDDTD